MSRRGPYAAGAHEHCKACGMAIGSYRDLDAWQLGMTFAVTIYELTASFPRDEQFGLTTQLRRAAASIPSHIAEGHRHPTRSYRHFVRIALGSQAECETHLELAKRLRLVPASRIDPAMMQAERLGKVLHGLARSLKARKEAS